MPGRWQTQSSMLSGLWRGPGEVPAEASGNRLGAAEARIELRGAEPLVAAVVVSGSLSDGLGTGVVDVARPLVGEAFRFTGRVPERSLSVGGGTLTPGLKHDGPGRRCSDGGRRGTRPARVEGRGRVEP